MSALFGTSQFGAIRFSQPGPLPPVSVLPPQVGPTVADSWQARHQMAGLLKDATDTISENQTLTFVPYVRTVLPLDGYVFWVKGVNLSTSAMYNAMGFGTTMFGDPGSVTQPTPFNVMGSVHYATDIRQDEDASPAINRVAFTAEEHVQGFNVVDPNLLYIATFRGIRFAFSGKGEFYEQARLWHYTGNAVYSTMATQVVDDPRLLDPNRAIVSNSLPAWLALPSYAPPYPVEVTMPRVPLYPSFLAPLNLPPPYGTVHIGPDDSSVDQPVPDLDRRLTQRQLSRDRVKVTLYGLTSDTAADFLMATLAYMRDAGVIGLCNDPNVRDEKLTQEELLTIAMKKTILFEVSYNTARVRDAARQLIERASATVEMSTAIN